MTSEQQAQFPVKLEIVEDEVITAYSLQMELTRLGFTVCGTAGNYEKALEIFNLEQPHYVLMDIRLAGKTNGIDTAIAMIDRSPEVKIIYMTGYTDENTRKSAMSTRPLAFLEKPVHVDSLAKLLQESG